MFAMSCGSSVFRRSTTEVGGFKIMARDPCERLPRLQDASVVKFCTDEVVQRGLQGVQSKPHLDSKRDQWHVSDRN